MMKNNMQYPPFYKKNLDEENDSSSKIFTIRLNVDEIDNIKRLQRVLRQPKFTTTIKQLMDIGIDTVESQPVNRVVNTIFDNKKRNWRTGVVEESFL